MLESGVILLWYGAIVNIPAGYIICDGNNGTPDLRDKFLVGAGNTYAVDAVGGESNHDHTFTTDGHSHNIPAGTSIGAGTDYAAATSNNTDSGTTSSIGHKPPYHALAYIMKT